MLTFSTKSLYSYIEKDNQASLDIYYDLGAAFNKSLKLYPKEVNIIGVYFFDILKLLTHSMLKKSELNQGIEPKNPFTLRRLDSWPYIGYEDITSGCDIDSKKFGKITPIEQNKLKLCLQLIVNKQYFFGSKFSKTVSLVSPSIDSGPNNLWLKASNLKTSLINQQSSFFSIPELNDQLKLLKNVVFEIIEKNNHPIDPALISDLLRRHIKADCNEGNLDYVFEGDILLLGSGVDLQNRMLSIAAYKKGIPIINVMHGESFGVHDEPVFSEFGEQMYSSAILGYGDEVIQSPDSYKFGMKDQVKYIKSNGVKVQRYFQSEFSGFDCDLNNLNYIYYPTSMSGATYRYGPFRDTADSLYFLWQKSLFNLFGDLIKVKVHPKEKHSHDYSFKELKILSSSFEDSLDAVDVFIFDFIGTAFSEACATDKPIIYFDLGIRNIASDALIEVKNRTVYFDIKNGLPSLNDIKEQLEFDTRENNYSRKYSLCGNSESRVESLQNGIKSFF